VPSKYIEFVNRDENIDFDEKMQSLQVVNLPNLLKPEYLMMWFARSEFDREACFHAVGGVRGSLEWEDFENLQLPIPHPDKQREIVKEYNNTKPY
jgi:restriction endonuclease S subunit